jgi:hypothetical protein
MRSLFRVRALRGLAVAVVLSACARSADPEARPVEPPTTVLVENRSWSQQTIYVVRGAQRMRLGQVSAASSRTFVIPRTLLFGATALRFIADPLGGNQLPVSQEITVIPGDQVRLMIPPS